MEDGCGQEEYIRQVLEAYRKTPGTAGTIRRPDRVLATQLYQRGVPVSVIENAFVLAAARRLMLPSSTGLLLPSAKAMSRICAETGGFQFNEKSFAQGFHMIEEELRSSYTIAFQPGRATADGKFHRIAIRSRKPDLTVRHRPGYRNTAPAPAA